MYTRRICWNSKYNNVIDEGVYLSKYKNGKLLHNWRDHEVNISELIWIGWTEINIYKMVQMSTCLWRIIKYIRDMVWRFRQALIRGVSSRPHPIPSRHIQNTLCFFDAVRGEVSFPGSSPSNSKGDHSQGLTLFIEFRSWNRQTCTLWGDSLVGVLLTTYTSQGQFESANWWR
jgi:hypothetical protein